MSMRASPALVPISRGRRGTRSSRPPSHGPISCGAKTQSPASAARPAEPEAGWTLVGATATVTGQADKFVLTHTCAATTPTTPSGTPTTTPATTTPATTTPGSTPSTGEVTPTPTGTGTSDSNPSPSVTPSTTPAPTTGIGDGGGLPLTGAAVSSVAALGAALVGGGATLLLRRRRRFVA